DAVRLREVEALNARLARWARAAPDLFRRQHLIVSAEETRLRGQEAEAIALYEQAVGAALTAACPRERALASEVSARVRRGRGEEQAGAILLVAARNAYAEWGAQAKVRDLERRHPDLLAGSTRDRTAGPLRAGRAAAVRSVQAGALGGSLDSVTIMKAARAVAGEIELEGLLRRLMRIALENAGAERGGLLLEHGGELSVEAEGVADGSDVNVLRAAPLDDRVPLARAVVQYVRRTGESVVLDDATADERFAGDPYVERTRPRSILCVPILHQGRV